MPEILKEVKSIDLAKISFERLRLFTNDCDPVVPEIASSVGRFIEAALFSKEINETEYIDNIEKLRSETSRFRKDCQCLKR